MVRLKVSNKGEEWKIDEVLLEADYSLSIKGEEFTLSLSKEEAADLLGSLVSQYSRRIPELFPAYVVSGLSDFIGLTVFKGGGPIEIVYGSPNQLPSAR